MLCHSHRLNQRPDIYRGVWFLWQCNDKIKGMQLVVQISQIILSIFLLAAILVQSKGVGLSGALGGGGEVYFARRGAEKVLFIATIVIAVLFVSTSILNVWMG